MSGPAGLTEDEHAAMRALGDAWDAFCKVVGNGPTREADIAEACPHIHALQQAVMSNAAARAHPTLYRELGDLVRKAADHRRRPEAATQHGHPMTHEGPNSRHSAPESHGTAELAPDDTPAISEAHSADTAKVMYRAPGDTEWTELGPLNGIQLPPADEPPATPAPWSFTLPFPEGFRPETQAWADFVAEADQ